MKKIFILFLLFGGGLVKAEQSNEELSKEYKKIQEKVLKIAPDLKHKEATSKWLEARREFRKAKKEFMKIEKEFYNVVLNECDRGLTTFTKDECVFSRIKMVAALYYENKDGYGFKRSAVI